MKLNVNKSLTAGEFKVSVEFKSYEVFEEGLIEDFGAPILQIPVSTWGATFSELEGVITIADIKKDNASANCTIDLTNSIAIKVNNLFKVEYSVKIADIDAGSLSAPLDSAVKMAEAKCALFVEIIKKEAKAKMDHLRAMKTDFEAVAKNPEVIKI